MSSPNDRDKESVVPSNCDVNMDHNDPDPDELNAGGSRGGQVNTPASFFNGWSENKIGRSQNVPSGSREDLYQRAMALMSQRCTNEARETAQQPIHPINADDPPINVNGPSVFFVKQNKPVPMSPLKVWRGYHGNVYFEPIKVVPAPTKDPQATPQPYLDSCSQPLHKLLNRRSHPGSTCSSQARGKSSQCYSETVDMRKVSGITRSLPSQSGRSMASTSKRTSKSAPSTYTRQMAVLDKRSVFQKHNKYIHAEIEWMMAQESTGSLCIINPKRGTADPRLRWDRERIRRGSVAHQVYMNKNGQNPLLIVNSNDKPSSSTESNAHEKSSTTSRNGSLPTLDDDEDCANAGSDQDHRFIQSFEQINISDSPANPTDIWR